MNLCGSVLKWSVIVVFAGVSILSSCSDDSESQPVVESEDVFINEIYAAGDDWLELYNAGDDAKNVGGYFIYDDATRKYTIPSGTTIPAKGFLVLVCDDTGTGLNTNFKLTSDGETVFLETPEAKLIDRVEFPALGDGQSYGRYPDGSDDFAVSGITSKGTSNGDTQAPAVTQTARTPIVPGLSDEVTVTASLANGAAVTNVKLYYRLGTAAYTEIPMTASSGKYTAAIPAQNTTGTVEYYVQVSDASGQTVVDPVTAPSEVYNFILNTDALPNLFINEFLASNTSCCPDNDGGLTEFDDWIEIYNAGSSPVDIGGMYVSDNKQNPFKYQIPATNASATTIPAGGFLLLWADNTKSQGTRHVEFSLDAAGEDVGIYYIDGRTISEYTFGAQSENKSMGRSTDGGATWVTLSNPSPGTSNN